MNWLDIGVVAIIVLSAVFAFARGFVREAFSVIAWGGAAAITLYGFGWAYDRVDPYVHNPLLSQVIAGFGLFVVSLDRADDGDRHSGAHGARDRVFADRPHARFRVRSGARRVSRLPRLSAGRDGLAAATDWPPWLRDAKSGPYLNEGADLLRAFCPSR